MAALGLGFLATQAEAACQVKPEFLVADPGESVVFDVECDPGQSFDTIQWTYQVDSGGSPPINDLTDELPVAVGSSDKVRLSFPVNSLGASNITYNINFIGKLAAATTTSAKVAKLIINPAKQVPLTVSKAGSGTGTITSGPTGIDCGADCTENYDLNTVVMLNATAGSNSTFAGWGGPCIGTGTCQVSMNATKLVTASFGAVENGACGTANGVTTLTAPSAALCQAGTASSVTSSVSSYTWSCAGTPGLGSTASCSAPRGYEVYVQAGANGTIDPNTTQVVAYNGSKPFTLTPGDGYAASLDTGHTCAGSLASNGLNYTATPVTGPCNVAIKFTNNPTCGAAQGTLTATAPVSGLCAIGTASAVTDGGTAFNWSCTASSQSTNCQAPKAVSINIGTISGGTISPNATQTIQAGQTRQFTLTPTTSGHQLTMGGTCGNLTGVVNNSNGTFTYTTAAVNQTCEVTATFSDSLGGCPVPASNVEVVNTSVPTAAYPRTDFSSVAPDKIYAFKVRSKPGTVTTSAYGIATLMTTGVGGKRIVISACPGDLTPVMAKCTKWASESTRLDYYTNLNSTSYCVVQPDTVYYLNVISKNNTTDTTYNCGSSTSPSTPTSKCAFSFTAN